MVLAHIAWIKSASGIVQFNGCVLKFFAAKLMEMPLLVKLVSHWLMSDLNYLLRKRHLIVQVDRILPKQQLLLDLSDCLCKAFVVQLRDSLVLDLFH